MEPIFKEVVYHLIVFICLFIMATLWIPTLGWSYRVWAALHDALTPNWFGVYLRDS